MTTATTTQALTRIEHEALVLASQGWSNDTIGERTYVTASTVKSTLGRVYRKLGARDRAHAVALAYQRGILGGPSTGTTVDGVEHARWCGLAQPRTCNCHPVGDVR